LRFTGREEDGTALNYYRARYYHPGLQRFISEDPIGFAGGDTNLYAYVANNPLLFVDPFGLDKSRRECWDEDYLTASAVLVPIPMTYGLFSITGQVTVDRYGNLYAGLGGSLARGLSYLGGAAVMRGFVDDPTGRDLVPREAQLRDFVGGWGTNGIVAAGLAVGRAWSANGGTAREAGWAIPQAGFTGGYMMHLRKTGWVSPLPGCGG
jgi:RHS repeat-associated protein